MKQGAQHPHGPYVSAGTMRLIAVLGVAVIVLIGLLYFVAPASGA